MLMKGYRAYANEVRVHKPHVLRLINLVSVSKPGFFTVFFNSEQLTMDSKNPDRIFAINCQLSTVNCYS